jgi:hypothetical protein
MNNIDLFITGFKSLDIEEDVIQITWRKHALNGSRLDIQLTWDRFVELYPTHTVRGAKNCQIAEHFIGDVCVLSVVP